MKEDQFNPLGFKIASKGAGVERAAAGCLELLLGPQSAGPQELAAVAAAPAAWDPAPAAGRREPARGRRQRASAAAHWSLLRRRLRASAAASAGAALRALPEFARVRTPRARTRARK